MIHPNKRNIVIVECRSTGINFIEDIVSRGYHPVILDPLYGDSETGDEYKKMLLEEYKGIEHDFEMIHEKESYEENLEMVREYNPLLVLPGSEKGVILASRLSHDLKLKCNPIENLDAMTLKSEMQKRLAEKGLRSIKGKVVRSIDEAIDFYDSEELTQVVLKPEYSTGSVSVRICSNKEEMIEYLEELFEKTNVFGHNLNEILVQERIIGDEYIVNTVSCEGKHKVTLVWKYNKIKTSEGANVYDTCETVNELNLGEAEMIEYAYDVADALGIEYGPIHGEYMIDEKGPVLIEVNCRPCGGHMSAEFLDKISGQHETDSILDAYLKPQQFMEKMKNKYELKRYGALKFFIVPKKIVASSTPMPKISMKLKSHVQTSMDNLDEEDKRTYFPTENVDTTCGIIYLVNEDYGVLQDNINYLRSVEKHAFSLILNEEKQIKMSKEEEEIDLKRIRKIVEQGNKYGTGLFVTDEFIPNTDMLQIHPENITDFAGDFDYIIVNLNKSMIENDPVELTTTLLKCFERLKPNGIIAIPKSTYQLFNSERKGIEALVKVLDFKIELPPYGMKDIIVASKR